MNYVAFFLIALGLLVIILNAAGIHIDPLRCRELFVRLFGETAALVFFFMIGVFLIVFGVLLALGIVT